MERNQQTDVHAADCFAVSPGQQWEIVHYGSYHYIRNIGYNQCLDLYNWDPSNGRDYQTWACNYGTNQLFQIPCTGCWGEIRNVSSQKCVTLTNSSLASFTVFEQQPCTGAQYGPQWFYLDTHSPENTKIEEDRWYQRYWQTYNYTTWMTLSFDRQVLSGGSEWDGYVTDAVNAWNGPASTNTAYLAESSPEEWHDVHLAVLSGDGCYFGNWGFVNACLQGALGRARPYGYGKQQCCPLTGAKVYYYAVLLNQPLLQGYSVAVRKDVTVHELGHAIAGLSDIQSDGYCYSNPRPRVMDYDCTLNTAYDGPKPFDSCAINHAYYDPNWGFQGC